MGDFYGTGIWIRAGFGPVGIAEKNNFGRFFQVFMGKKKYKNIVASVLKSCIK